MSAFTLIIGLMAFSAPVSYSDSVGSVSSVGSSMVTYKDECAILDCSMMKDNITCSQCIHGVDVLKDNLKVLINITNDVKYICGKIVGPTAHECVEVTEKLIKSFQYMSSNNSTVICRELHYC
jgi:hypothetical protein